MPEIGRFAIVPAGRTREGLDTDPLTGGTTVAHSELIGEIYETASGRRGVVAGVSRLYGESDVVVAIPLSEGERPASTGAIFRRDGRRYELLSVAATQVVQQLRERKLARGEPLNMPRTGQSRGHVRPSAERIARELDPAPRRRRLRTGGPSTTDPPLPPSPQQPPPRRIQEAPEPVPAVVEQTSLIDWAGFDQSDSQRDAAVNRAQKEYVAEVGDRGRLLVWAASGGAPRRLHASGRLGSPTELVNIARDILEDAMDIDSAAIRADAGLADQFALDCRFFAERFLRVRSKSGWTASQSDIRAWMASHRPPSLAYVRLAEDSPLAEERRRWLEWRSRQTHRRGDPSPPAMPGDRQLGR